MSLPEIQAIKRLLNVYYMACSEDIKINMCSLHHDLTFYSDRHEKEEKRIIMGIKFLGSKEKYPSHSVCERMSVGRAVGAGKEIFMLEN